MVLTSLNGNHNIIDAICKHKQIIFPHLIAASLIFVIFFLINSGLNDESREILFEVFDGFRGKASLRNKDVVQGISSAL